MKDTENADRPMSAMLYSSSRRWPLRRSGRPAQTSFSAEIRASQGVHGGIESKEPAAPPEKTVMCDAMRRPNRFRADLLQIGLVVRRRAGASKDQPVASPSH